MAPRVLSTPTGPGPQATLELANDVHCSRCCAPRRRARVPRPSRPVPSHPPHRRHRLSPPPVPARNQCPRGLVAAQARPARLRPLRRRRPQGQARPLHVSGSRTVRLDVQAPRGALGTRLAAGARSRSPPRPRGCTPRMPAWRSPKRKPCPSKPASTWRRSLRRHPPRRCQRVGSPAVIIPRSPQASGRPSAPTSPASAAAAMKSAMGAGSISTRTPPAIPPSAMAAPGMVLHEHVIVNSC